MIHITEYPCFHEQGYYTPGDTGAPVYRTQAGAIGVAICYDRHYPEYMRALALGGADLVVVPQAGALDEWPEGLYEGEMRVAAFQNGYFVALCNRVGEEECLTFAGESFVCAPDGRVIGARAEARGCHPRSSTSICRRPRRRTRGGCSCSIGARSSTPSGRVRDADVSRMARAGRLVLCRWRVAVA